MYVFDAEKTVPVFPSSIYYYYYAFSWNLPRCVRLLQFFLKKLLSWKNLVKEIYNDSDTIYVVEIGV